MSHLRWPPAALILALTLIALTCVCFARLIDDPTSIIVDGSVPSIDHAKPGEPRGVGNDATFSFLPHHLSIARTIRQYGHVPLWDDRGFCGRPLAANPQGGIFYPPVWLVWCLGIPSALGWLTVGHLLWGGIGTYVLARSFRLGAWSATVAAGTYQASPLLLAHTFEGHYPHVWSACWYPWAFWAYSQHRRGGLGGRAVLPIILALTLLTGHPQEWLLLVLALTSWAIVDASKTARARGVRQGIFPLVGWMATLALSIGIAAVQIAPELAVRRWLPHNPGAPAGLGIPRRYDIGVLNAWQLLSPTALGGPADYFGDDNYWETLLSIGLVPLFLATVGAFRHPDRKLVRGWLAVAGLAIWLACGRHLGFFALVYLTVPGMSWFRVPARALFLANLAGAILAGLGCDTLHKHMIFSRDWHALGARFRAVASVLLAGSLVVLVVHSSDVRSRSAAATTRVLGSGCFWWTLCGIIALIYVGSRARGPSGRRRAGGLLGLLALVELGWCGFALVRVAPIDRFLGDPALGAAIIRLDHESHQSGRTRVKARDSFYTDLQAVAVGIEKTNINDVFQIEHAARLYELLYPVASFQRRRLDGPMQDVVDDYHRQIRQAVFDRLSVRYLVSRQVEADPAWPVAAEKAGCRSSWVIQRNPSAVPRAYVVSTATVTDENESLILARFREVDPRQTVFMSVDPLEHVPDNPRQPFTAAEWTSIDPDHPVVTVTTKAPGLLVISDTWMPGWTARVDGQPASIFLGNIGQRVVPLPQPGRHTVTMDYHPPGLAWGSALTVLSILTWGFMVVRARANVPPGLGPVA